MMRQPGADLVQVKQMLGTFGHRVSFAAEDQAEIKSMLLHLLRLIMENIGELSIDDHWLKGQVEALIGATTPPLTLRRLDDVERRWRDVMQKQAEAKGRAVEAQKEMRLMLGTFIERLSLITTRTMAGDTLTARNELRGMRERAEATEAEIIKLHMELDRVSAQARHDPLTGAHNRKGLDEAVNREVSNRRRKETPLCMALLDIDDFLKTCKTGLKFCHRPSGSDHELLAFGCELNLPGRPLKESNA